MLLMSHIFINILAFIDNNDVLFVPYSDSSSTHDSSSTSDIPGQSQCLITPSPLLINWCNPISVEVFREEGESLGISITGALLYK